MFWGGSGIEKVVFDYIRANIKVGSVVVELGAGLVSTKCLSEYYDLYSVEHQRQYINLFWKSNYIFAPLVNDWYDIEILEKELPKRELQELILIDGANRKGILDHLDLFNPKAMYLIHDTYRNEEIETANMIGKQLQREVQFHTKGDYWATI